MRSARAACPSPSRCGTMKRQRSSGSATVADRPMLVTCGARRNSRARSERQQIAALRRHQRMQFIEHDAAQRAEQIRRIGGGEQQRQLLRRRQQNFRRIAALALALRGRRIAGARLDADRQISFPRSALPDCARCRRQAPSAEKCRACAGRRRGGRRGRSRAAACARPRGLRRATPRSSRPGSAEIPPASCRRRSARSEAPSGRTAPWPEVPIDARAASSRARRTSGQTSPEGVRSFRVPSRH